MKQGNSKVEQVDKSGNIIKDQPDTVLTKNELYNVLNENLGNLEKKGNFLYGEYKGNKYSVRVKNITYLGGKHKKYKKRYQIPNDLKTFYDDAKEKKMKPLMIGVYTYGDNTLFVYFNIDTYIDKKANNSSAHVYTTDLAAALIEDENGENGYYKKIDYFGNEIIVFNSDKSSVEYFMNEILGSSDDQIQHELLKIENAFQSLSDDLIQNSYNRKELFKIKIKERENRLTFYGKNIIPTKIQKIFLDFFDSQEKEWNGIDCYKEMLQTKYRNRNQGEWPGYYLEYKFEDYIEKNNLKDEVRYEQDKTIQGIDLDLYFPKMNSYGDLKAHSNDSAAVPGNDTQTVQEVIRKNGRIFYIICEHSTIKDKDCEYEVTKYWNENKDNKKKNQNPLSYKNRMKNSVSLKTLYILCVDKDNYKNLKVFKQGKNSDGKPRKTKIMIDIKDMNKFLKMKYDLVKEK